MKGPWFSLDETECSIQKIKIIRIKLLGQCQDKGLYQANVDLEAESLSKTELVNYWYEPYLVHAPE